MTKGKKSPELEDESEDLFDPANWEVETDEEDTFSEDDEDYQVEFYSDEDSDEEAEIVSEEPLPVFDKEAHLKKLNEKYKQSLIECHLALEGKLKWVEFKLEPPPPFNPSDFLRIKKVRTKGPKVKRWVKTFDVKIIIDCDLGVCFVWKVQKSSKPCKYLVEGQECPFGPEKCHHNHGPPPTEKHPQLCKYIRENQPCPFKDYCLYQHKIVQKDKLCKYYRNQQPCPFKEKCMYKHETLKPTPVKEESPKEEVKKYSMKYKPPGPSICKHASKCKMNLAGKCKFVHSRKDIKGLMKPCPRGEKCDAVKLCSKKLVNKSGEQIFYYKNVDGGCGFVHPREELDAFAYRMIK